MRYFITGATILLLLLISFSIAAGMEANEKKDLELPAEGIERTEIECGAGFLKVSGVEGLSSIRVEAEISVDGIGSTDLKKFLEDHITLTLTKKGETAVLKSKTDGLIPSGKSCTIDLTVQLPKKMSLAIADGSGYIELTDLNGNLEIADGSGEITAENINGNVNISDGSGEITIVNVGGDLNINDGSGDMDVRKILGNVNISDGSGDISIDDVGLDVNLQSSGSGDEKIKNVKGKINR